MPLLIDGHNLIGSGVFEDIRLSDEDDEAKLVSRLRVWRSRYRGKITVVFDRGIPGGWDRNLSGAGVDVVFATSPREADDLICRRLEKRPKNLELVSNDARLISVASTYGVSTLRGDQLVERFTLTLPDAEELGAETDVQLSKDEVAEWIDLFTDSGAVEPHKIAPQRLRPRKPNRRRGP